MILCPAQAFDIPAIMKIEHSAFIPQIQEKQRVFDNRLLVFPQGFFVLVDTSEEIIKKQGNALTAGYLTSEIWNALPDFSVHTPEAQKALARSLKLGHAIHKTHLLTGGVLYISSFALLPQYRGSGLGFAFFRASLGALCGAFSHVHTVMLLVCEEWASARKIYTQLGFSEQYTLPGFFPSLHKKNADGIIMTASAERFRQLPLTTNANGAMLVQPDKR